MAEGNIRSCHCLDLGFMQFLLEYKKTRGSPDVATPIDLPFHCDGLLLGEKREEVWTHSSKIASCTCSEKCSLATLRKCPSLGRLPQPPGISLLDLVGSVAE